MSARYIVGAVGGIVGFLVGGPAGASLGWTLGVVIGTAIFPPPPVEGPRLEDLNVQVSTYGNAIPRCWGWVRVAGNVIWATDLIEVENEEKKGGKGGPSQIYYDYFGNFSISFAENDDLKPRPAEPYRMWADGKLIWARSGTGNILSEYDEYITWYDGNADQLPSSLMESYEGVGNVPSYRGIFRMDFDRIPLKKFGNRIPNISVEIFFGNNSGEASFLDTSHYAWLGSNAQFPHRLATNYYNGVGTFWWVGEWNSRATTGDYQDPDWVNTERSLYSSNTFDLELVEGELLDANWSETPIQVNNLTAFPNSIIHVEGTRWVSCLISNFNVGTSGSNRRAVLFTTNPSSENPNKNVLQTSTDGNSNSRTQQVYTVDILGNPVVEDQIINQVYGYLTYASGVGDYRLSEIVKSVEVRQTGAPKHYVIIHGGGNFGAVNSHWNGFYVVEVDKDTGTPSSFVSQTLSTKATFSADSRFCFVKGKHDAGFRYLYYINEEGSNPIIYRVPFNYNGTFGTATVFYTFPVTATGLRRLMYCSGPDYIIAGYKSGSDAVLFALDSSGSLVWTQTYTNWGVADFFIYSQEQQFDNTGNYFLVYQEGEGDATYERPAWVDARDGTYVREIQSDYVQQGGPLALDFGNNGLGGYDSYLVKDPHIVMCDYNKKILYWAKDVGDLPPEDYVLPDQDSVCRSVYDPNYLITTVPLKQIVGDVCDGCEMTEGDHYNVDELTDLVYGYIIARQTTGRGMIEPLQPVYFFDGIEEDSQLVFKHIDKPLTLTLDEPDLATVREGAGAVDHFRNTRTQELELPERLVIRYSDPSRAYQPGAQAASRYRSAQNSRQEISIDVPVIMENDLAKQVASKNLYLAWAGRTNYELSLPRKYVRLSPGDIVRAIYGNRQADIYITSFDQGPDSMIKLKGRSHSELQYIDSPETGTDVSIVIPPPTETSEMVTVMIDGPLLFETMDPYDMFHFAGEGESLDGTWPGGFLYKSSDGGLTFNPVGRASTASLLGTASTVLPFHKHTTVDRTNTLRVNIGTGTLESVTFRQLMGGDNRFMLGNELCAYQTATQISAGVYDLSVLLRGVQGTEWASGSHSIGDQFCPINAARLAPAMIQPSDIGSAQFYKGVSIGISIAEADAFVFTARNNHRKPLAPAHLRGSLATNDWTFTWVRRARMDPEWKDITDAPLDEPIERYILRIYNGAAVVRTVTIDDASTYLYTEASQIADFGSVQTSLTIDVCQWSTRVGYGYFAQATVGDG